jgi:flagellar hook-associated protein 1 FlgK
MGGLNATLSIATGSLMAQETELSISNNNIANANTPGYSREIVNLQESQPTEDGSLALGGGVDVVSIQSVQDELLNMSINQQTSAQSSANAQVNVLNQIQTLFPSSGSSVSSALSTFFTSLSALSSSPTDSADRETVISDAQNLVQQFNTTAAGLSAPISGLNTQVQTDVAEINQLSSQAATLNAQIIQQKAAGQDSSPQQDQISEVETKLAALTNISVTHTPQGDSISTANGTPLVLGTQSYALSTSTGANGNQQVFDSQGNNITSSISSGDLGGTIQVRDTEIPAFQQSLDTLANQFATAFNAAQASGYDAGGHPGAALFTVPSTVTGSAAGIALATTDPDAIASASSATSGGGGNVANLTAVQNATLPSGQNATTMSANLVYQVGNVAANASAESTATGLSLTSLTNQQTSVSGVSIDEESANLIRYQQAYEAAARVVSTIAALFSDTINMIPAGS